MAMISRLTRRRRSAAVQDLVPTGLVCSVPGCASDDGRPCAYRDRRGRPCQVSNCPAHSIRFEHALFCRRHAGTARAIAAPAGRPQSLPDLDDRTPSLINWVADDLDEAIRGLLMHAARRGELVVTDGYVQRTRDINRQSRWERSWRIVDHTGLVLKVCIYVNAGEDAVVHIRVGDDDVFEAIPPWISRRRHEELAPEIDVARRQRFYEAIQSAIRAALQNRHCFRREHGTRQST
jgi:hypothetical protein